ncbi:MAG: hypothetical protein M3P40_09105 [Actinomycetota bacterium]|nr:hypothetical protein [Actinomycetota bacterium]
MASPFASTPDTPQPSREAIQDALQSWPALHTYSLPEDLLPARSVIEKKVSPASGQ